MKKIPVIEHENAISEITQTLCRIEQQFRKAMIPSLEWLEANDICAILNIPRSTLVTYGKRGKIPCGKFGGKYLFRLTDINNFLTSQINGKK